jgi:hypothetical protein
VFRTYMLYARGCAKRTAVASDASILKVVTRVLRVQLCSAELTAVESDANTLKVAVRVGKVQSIHTWYRHDGSAGRGRERG